MGETVPEVLNTARTVCLKQIITRVINKQIITRVSKKDERIDELDTKAAGKKYSKGFLRLNNYFKISSIERDEKCTKVLKRS